MKVFLTGITGYIGSKVALHAAEKGFVVHALVRDLHSPNIPSHDNIILHKGVAAQ
jgi:nucleoside-diphosphate-sugar epimerase